MSTNVDEIAKNKNRFVIIKSIENVNYFNFIYVDVNNFFNTTFIVNIERYLFYRDVYVFIDRLKNFVNKFIDEQRIKIFLFDCLRDDVFI